MSNKVVYKVIIVEDELAQREALEGMLARCPELEIVGAATSVTNALQLLRNCKPDLVFMDVLLPPSNSFEILDNLREPSFDIIFTTSYEEYAVKAFRISAVDFLVKPISLHELLAAIEKFKNKRQFSNNSQHIRILLENLQVTNAEHTRIALPTLTGYLFVRVTDVIRCESDNTYTTFFTVDKKRIIVSRTLKECEEMLGALGFYRVHNSHLVNLQYIVEYVKGDGGIVKMIDGAQIDVSRRRKDDFINTLRRA